MSVDVEKDQRVSNLRFLWAAGILYAETNPQLSKHFISKFHGLSSIGTRIDDQPASSLYCLHCFNLLRPGNHYARVSPKYHITNVAKLERQIRKDGFRRVNTRRRIQLQRWQNSRTKLLVHCNDCQELAKIPCSKRRTVQHQPLGFKNLARHRARLEVEQEKSKTTATAAATVTHGTGYRSGSKMSTQSFSRTPQRPTPQHPTPQLSTPQHSTPRFNVSVTPSGTPASARKARSLQKKGKHNQLQLQMMLAGAKQEKANAKSKLQDFLVSL
ncbi:uncharacterized protein LOC117289468 isoform X1 [Asterias rubens]|uniref:uncharacterized protein LOC117289468 isoform X1 n=1 Tax=Asterias rubens TaxID=7604 RepID=UPI001455430B|nr:uncharacterized protein LOC117289468 isoform X1 [Asterias rubens]